MGLFSKFKGGKKEDAQPIKGLNDLLEIEFQNGEFTLPYKLWNHLSSYTFRAENNNLWLSGDRYFNISNVSQMINEFAAKFGVDGLGEGSWTNKDNEDLKSFGSISRDWYFDENFNGKTTEWVADESNNYDYTRQISISCDKNDDADGVELVFTGWTMIKEHLKK